MDAIYLNISTSLLSFFFFCLRAGYKDSRKADKLLLGKKMTVIMSL